MRGRGGEREYTFPKHALVERVEKNRDAHRALYEAACRGYKDRVIAELEQMLRVAQTMDSPEVFRVGLLVPENHVEDYERLLDMLDMTSDMEIVLNEQEFAQYVRDDWAWSASFFASTVGIGYVGENGEYPG